jgi:hypothetical protein
MIPSKCIPPESTIYGEGMQSYVQEVMCDGRPFGAGGAQNVELVSKEAITNTILNYFISKHREQSVVDIDEHSDNVSK